MITEQTPRGFTLALFLVTCLVSDFGYCSQIASISESSISRLIKQPTITAILKDRNGFLWIGTQQGLYKFDGNNLTAFSSTKKGRYWIPASDIRAISQDIDGALFVATFGGGLLRWSGTDASFKSVVADQIPKEKYLTALLSSKSGHVWTATKEGISAFDSKLSRDTSWIESHPLARKLSSISSMAEDSLGNVFVASASGVYRLSTQDKSIDRLALSDFDKARHGTIWRIALDNQDFLYAGTDTGNIFAFDLKNHTLIAKKVTSHDSATSITSLLVSDDIIWIGTNNGLSYSDRLLSFYTTYRHEDSQLSNNHITSFFKDEKFIWVGTYLGLNTLSFVPFESFNKQNSDVFDDVLAFEEDIDGKVWIGTFNGVYIADDRSSGQPTDHQKNFSTHVIDQRIMTLAAKDEDMWLGFRNSGVQVINTRTNGIYTPKLTDEGQLEVTKILHSNSGKTWIGTYNKGLIEVSKSGVRSFLADQSLPETSVTVLFESNRAGLLVGTEKNIYQYSETEDRFSKLDLKLDNDTRPTLVLSINQSDNNDIWIGTKDQGLFRWPEGSQLAGSSTILPIEGNGELALSTIYGIQFDSQGYAWCSTQRGIVKLDPNGSFLTRFTMSEGLQGDDFNFGASFSDSAGKIYFGGMKGYTRFSPEKVVIDHSAPQVLVVNVDFPKGDMSSEVHLNTPTTLNLTHKDYFVKFHFSVLDFLDPDKNQYRYKLEGFDPDWIENGTRNSATYTNLPAGDYVLRVQGANSAGVWNREGASLIIVVEPPPWFSWWAYCIYGVILSFLGWMGKRSYDSYAIERRARQMAVTMHEAAERADDEMQEQLEIQDDLVKSVYQHNVSTLNLVSQFISQQSRYLNDATAREAIENSINLVDALALLESCVFYQNDKVLADLNKYLDIIIPRLLKRSPVNAERITTINEVSTQLVPIDVASSLAVAIYELLENCIQHAFDDESLANYIHITFDTVAESPELLFQLTVQDSGLGMPANVNLHMLETSGLTIVNSMAISLSGVLTMESEEGTKMQLTFPATNMP